MRLFCWDKKVYEAWFLVVSVLFYVYINQRVEKSMGFYEEEEERKKNQADKKGFKSS